MNRCDVTHVASIWLISLELVVVGEWVVVPDEEDIV